MHLFSFFFSLATTAIAGSVNCPPESYIGLLPGTCIFSNNVTYWTAAEATCAELGGQLACPQSEAENALVSLPPNGYSCRAPNYSWLGATYDVFSKNWTSLNGSSLTYTKWAEGYPTMSTDPSCIYMNTTSQKWYNAACDDIRNPALKNFVCQMPTNSSCPAKLLPLAGGCISFGVTPVRWIEAQSYCLEQGSHLVAIKNRIQNRALWGFFSNRCLQPKIKNYLIWIGATRLLTGDWSWLDGSPLTYSNWMTGYPTNDTASACAYMGYTTGKWLNIDCAVDYNNPVCGTLD